MTHSDILAVVKLIPTINSTGIGNFDRVPPEERQARILRDQGELLADTDGCSRAETWLRDIAKAKTIDRYRGSYSLKHLAEEEVGYITNGAFIAAAIHLGFAYEVIACTPNVWFGMSGRSIRRKITLSNQRHKVISERNLKEYMAQCREANKLRNAQTEM